MPRRNSLGFFGKSQTERFGTFLALDFGRVSSHGRLQGKRDGPLVDDLSARSRKGRSLTRNEKNGKGSFGKLHGGGFTESVLLLLLEGNMGSEQILRRASTSFRVVVAKSTVDD